jgi:hypothetical protein
MKKELKEKFDSLFIGYRLLAIQLNGFTHSIIFDDGNADSDIIRLSYSGYMGSVEKRLMGIKFDDERKLEKLFDGIGHHQYQNNSKELLYIHPNER